ncbi:hypothetical protein AVEN_82493-1, partial [Araneus ventricosus]
FPSSEKFRHPISERSLELFEEKCTPLNSKLNRRETSPETETRAVNEKLRSFQIKLFLAVSPINFSLFPGQAFVFGGADKSNRRSQMQGNASKLSEDKLRIGVTRDLRNPPFDLRSRKKKILDSRDILL